MAQLANIVANQVNDRFRILGNSSDANGPAIDLCGPSWSYDNRWGSIWLYARDPSTPTSRIAYSFMTHSNTDGYKSRMRLHFDGKFAVGDVGSEKFLITSGGNVGIGNTSPSEKLHVNGNTIISGKAAINGAPITGEGLTVKDNISLYSSVDQFRNVIADAHNGGINIFSGTSLADGSGIHLHARNEPNSPGKIGFTSYAATDNGPAFLFQTYYPGGHVWAPRLTIDNLGDAKFSSKIAVNGAPITDEGLTVKDNIHLSGDGSDQFRSILAYSNTGGIRMFSGANDGADGSCMILNAKNAPTDPGMVGFVSRATNNEGIAYNFMTYVPSTNSWPSRFSINNQGNARFSGKVTIGDIADNNMPGNYFLYVEKGILTEKIKVALKTDNGSGGGWSDFVFNDDYQLMPLNKVESFIEKNKHLPEIPSAAEVAKDGIDLAQMDAKLLQKIEELTLYVIQQQKRIEELEKQNKK